MMLETRRGDTRRRDRQPCNPVEDRREQPPRYGDLGQRERDVLRVPHDLRPDVHQLFAERGHSTSPLSSNCSTLLTLRLSMFIRDLAR